MMELLGRVLYLLCDQVVQSALLVFVLSGEKDGDDCRDDRDG